MKNFLITGASKGLGLTLAKSLLAETDDTNLYVLNRTLTPELQRLMDTYTGRVHFKQYDLANTNDVKKEIFKQFVPIKIPIHGFVNNAAMAYDDIVTNLNTDQLLKMYHVNVFTPMNIVKYVIRNMLFHKVAGSIVHISSISVHTGYKGLSMYASTKGALEAFSKNTAREWGRLGIRSNALVAGFMETNMSGTLSEDQKNRIYNRTALKKATTKESVASTVVHLLGSGSQSITGQNIFVDSGTI